MEDIYEMLNYIFDENLMTHQLPTAIRKLKEVNPEWFRDAVNFLNEVKAILQTDNFEELMSAIDSSYSDSEIELGKIDAKFKFFDGLV